MKMLFLPTLICTSLTLGAAAQAPGGIQSVQPLLLISRPADQTVRLDCSGAPAGPFLLQTATDIERPAWTNVLTAVPDARGTFSWLRPCPNGETRRFFRLAQSTGGLLARNGIVFNGRAYLDSFDSSDTNFSTGGLYDPAKRRDHALALTASQSADAISLRVGHIYGTAATGPGGTILCGKGAVGDLAWNASQFGVQPGHGGTNVSLLLQDITPPSTTGFSVPAAGSFSGQDYSFLLGSGKYGLSSLKLTGGDCLAVTGNAALYVTGDVELAGNSSVYIAPGATLQLYVGGNLTCSGRGIINGNQSAANCWILGLPSCTAMTFGGTSTLYAVVDAPEAGVTFSGAADACGSFMAGSFVVNGGAGIHYDESLAEVRSR